MIDLKKFRENPEPFIKGTEAKQEILDFEKFIQLDKQLRVTQKKLDEINHQIKILSEKIKNLPSEERQKLINQVKKLKKEQKKTEEIFKKIKQQHYNLWIKIPNPPDKDVPYGTSDEDNVVVKIVGEKIINNSKEKDKCYINRKNSFETVGTKPSGNPKPHREILEKRKLFDSQRGSKISGSRFRYIKENLVLLELALINFVIDKLIKKGFSPIIGPNIVKKEAMFCTGFFPAEEIQIYHINPNEDNLYLIGTSEVTLVAQHMNEVLDINDLPLRYVGISPCYRREVGKSGKDIRGLIRLHQFEKVEIVSFVKPEDSKKEHEYLVSIEEEIYTDLGIPYRKMLICSGDLGSPAAKKYDLEAWMSGMKTFKEITSCSNTTDYQARRGNIKFKDGKEKQFVHTLNGTAIALQRVLAAITENYQTDDLRIVVPKVLRKFILGNIKIF